MHIRSELLSNQIILIKLTVLWNIKKPIKLKEPVVNKCTSCITGYHVYASEQDNWGYVQTAGPNAQFRSFGEIQFLCALVDVTH